MQSRQRIVRNSDIEFALPNDISGAPFWKRALDISCVLIAIPTLLPLILLIAVLIKVSSKGPVLFKQERVGFRCSRFILFKFRTMLDGADMMAHEKHVANLIKAEVPMIKLDACGDTRLTPIGPLLRVSGLDELPQLINVLRGEMSLVGPRPCLRAEYSRLLPWQKERFNSLPGLTGLWQVSGKNRMTFNEMIECDLKYVRSRSLYLDFKIMLKTIPAMIVEMRNAHLGDPTAPPPPNGGAPVRHAQSEPSVSFARREH